MTDQPPSRSLPGLLECFVADGDRLSESIVRNMYAELHELARAQFRHQPSHQTLQPTALVNEAYLKLAEQSQLNISDRQHFFVLAARIMRQILVDHARARNAAKRGGGRERVTISDVQTPATDVPGGEHEIDLLALEEALTELAELNPDRARLVELRYFSGLTTEQAAEVLGVSRSDVTRQWRTTRAWLASKLAG